MPEVTRGGGGGLLNKKKKDGFISKSNFQTIGNLCSSKIGVNNCEMSFFFLKQGAVKCAALELPSLIASYYQVG